MQLGYAFFIGSHMNNFNKKVQVVGNLIADSGQGFTAKKTLPG